MSMFRLSYTELLKTKKNKSVINYFTTCLGVDFAYISATFNLI